MQEITPRVRMMQHMKASHMSFSEIAHYFGITKQRVAAILKKYPIDVACPLCGKRNKSGGKLCARCEKKTQKIAKKFSEDTHLSTGGVIDARQ